MGSKAEEGGQLGTSSSPRLSLSDNRLLTERDWVASHDDIRFPASRSPPALKYYMYARHDHLHLDLLSFTSDSDNIIVIHNSNAVPCYITVDSLITNNAPT